VQEYKQVEKDNDIVVAAEGDSPDLQTLFRRFWKVAAPYWTSDDKVQARLQLAGVFALTLATTGISVGFSFLGRDFFNALASKFHVCWKYGGKIRKRRRRNIIHWYILN